MTFPRVGSYLSGLVLAALPKCPLCLGVWGAAFSALGITSASFGPFLVCLSVLLVTFVLYCLKSGAGRRDGVLLGLGAAFVIIGRFNGQNTTVMILGVLILLSSALYRK